MKYSISRRSFCRHSLLAPLALGIAGATTPTSTRAVEPFRHSATPRLQLALAAYSFREHFTPGEKNPPKPTPSGAPLDMFAFVDYCAEHLCDGAEVTSYFPKKIDRDYLIALKRHAFLRGVAISGTAVGNSFTHPAGPDREKQLAMVRTWIEHAAVLGAPHIRIFAGEQQKGTSLEEARQNCIQSIEVVGKYAAEKGVFLGIENHGGIVADPDGLLAIVKSVSNPWVGVNLDTGNFNTPDPYADLERCAPYAVNVQFKAEMRAKGKPSEEADLPRVLAMLRGAKYQGYVALEYEAAEDPWVGVPKWLGRLRQEIDRTRAKP